ncbi:MAG TPA: type II toxin-antitoxin system RelE/ParE family toxin [Stellaceae bacterium]|nr:type II toxin-antitoxin system RelE/ParE family toxin [Stellaceae bacterium]
MASKLITVVETPTYLRDATKLLTEAERAAVVDTIAANPAAGVVIVGSGGVRKLRIALQGRGKRGGARVIYFYHGVALPVFLLALFAKNERDNLSEGEIGEMAKFVKALIRNYGAR